MNNIMMPIYLDGFATMPLAVEARDAMLVAWSQPGNAGSLHHAGERAAAVIAEARAHIAQLINSSPGEITFTSGATEANNLAILGVAAHATDILGACTSGQWGSHVACGGQQVIQAFRNDRVGLL